MRIRLSLTFVALVLTSSSVAVADVQGEGNAPAQIKARTNTFFDHNFVRFVNGCGIPKPCARQVGIIIPKQIAYEHFVSKDAARPAPCGSAARGLRFRLQKSEASMQALSDVFASGKGATYKTTFQVVMRRLLDADTASRRYLAACGQ